MSQDELKSVATSVKFSAAVPDVLLRRLAAARLFDSAVLAQESNRLGRPVCRLCVRSGDQTPRINRPGAGRLVRRESARLTFAADDPSLRPSLPLLIRPLTV